MIAVPAVVFTDPPNFTLASIDASGRVDLGKWLGSVPDALSSGKLPADVKLWLTAAPAALSTNGYVQAMLLRWLTDNAGGTPNALASSRVDASVGAYPGNTAQTGDNFARIGAAGAALTALGDTRLAHLDADVSSRSTYAGGAVASVTAPVTVGTNNDKTGYTASTVTDKAGYSLSAPGVQAIWDALTSALTTAGSIGKRLVDFVTTLVYAAPLSAGQVENAVLDATAASHNTAGSIGNKINAAGSAADPWTTALPGSYASGQAGKILGDLSLGGATLYGENGSITYTFTVFDTDDVTPLPGVAVYVSSDLAGMHRSQTKLTDALGKVQFDLDPSTIYVWPSRADRSFTVPIVEIVS